MTFVVNNDSCPFCNGRQLKRFRVPAHDAPGKMVSVIECYTCQAGWQWPLQRTEIESSKEFNDAYSEKREGSYFDRVTRESVAELQRDFLHERLPFRPGRLLDIGCGDGVFARAMARAGWDVVGIDPSLRFNVIEDQGGGSLSLINKTLEELPVDEPFDVITLWDVVEHVERPDLLISQASDLLKEDGFLIVETGNYQSAGRVMSDGKWWNYQIDHRWYLAPPQLKKLMSSAGIDRIEISNRVLRPWWSGHPGISSPTLISLLKNIVLNPLRAVHAWRCHNQLVQGAELWKNWGGLEIMTMIGRRYNS